MPFNSRSQNSFLDWWTAIGLACVQAGLCLPLFNRGISYFDEGTQLRMAQVAIGEVVRIADVAPKVHAYPGFHLLYGIWFRLFDLSLFNLRLEVLLVMTTTVFLFTLLARCLLSRTAVLGIFLMYASWQWSFWGFAYYSREANLAALMAMLAMALWINQEQRKYLLVAAVSVVGSISFKFNIGVFTLAPMVIFLLFQWISSSKSKNGLFWFLIYFVVGMFGLLLWDGFDQEANLLGNMVFMPVSYARHLHTPIPWRYAWLIVPWVMAFKYVRKERSLMFLLWLWYPFSLLQNFPRHWLAHLLWIPLPFWIITAYLLQQKLKPRLNLVLGVGLTLCVSLSGLWHFKPWLHVQQNQSLLTEKHLNIRVSAPEKKSLTLMKQWVAQHTSPGEGIFVFPVQPLFYFLLQRPNVTKFDNLHGGWRWQDEVITELKRNPPKIVILIPEKGVWNLDTEKQAPRVYDWIKDHYVETKRIKVEGALPIAIWQLV